MRRLLIIVFWLIINHALAQDVTLGIPEGHTGTIELTRFSPDGKYILTAGEDKTARLWETYSTKLIQTVKLPDEASYIQFHPSGKKLLVVTDSVRVYDVPAFKKIFSVQGYKKAEFTPDGKSIITCNEEKYNLEGKRLKNWAISGIDDFVQSRDGRYIAGCDADSVFIYTASNNKPLLGFPFKADYYLNDDVPLEFSPDGNSLLIVGKDSILRVVTIKTGVISMKIDVHMAIDWVKFHPQGRFIVMAGQEDEVKIIDTKTSRIVRRIPTSTTTKKALYSPDGKYLLITDLDSTRVWDQQTGKLSFSIAETQMDRFSDDSKLLLSTRYEYWSAIIRAVSTGNEQGRIENHAKPVSFKSYTNNYEPLITSFADYNVRLWDPITGRLINTLEGHKEQVQEIVFSSNGKYMITIPYSHSKTDHSVRVWESKTGKQLHALYDTLANWDQPKGFHSYRFSPDGKHIFIDAYKINGETSLDVFETISGKLLYSFITKDTHNYEVSFTPDGSKFVMATPDDSLRVYQTHTGKIIKNLAPYNGWMHHDGFTSTGEYIISQDDSLFSVWKAADYKLMYTLPRKKADHLDVENVSADGKEYIIRTDSVINFVDLVSGKITHSIYSGEKEFSSVKLSKSGKYVISSYDRSDNHDKWSVKVWNSRTGEVVVSVPIKTHINNVHLTGNEDYLVTTANYNTYIWNIKKKALAATIYGIESEYVIVLPSGYYQCSPGSAKYLYYLRDNKSIGFDQLDLKFNRPDLVIEEMSRIVGKSDSLLANLYLKAYEKRLSKLGVSTSSINQPFNVPEAEIVNREEINAETTEKEIRLHIKASDQGVPLSRLNVWINEVPLMGLKGVPLGGRKGTNSIDTTVTIALSQFENRIEMSVTNRNGSESYRKPLFVTYRPPVIKKSKIYFVGIGVNKYVDSTRNLVYAAKDIGDLADEFNKRYPGSEVVTFLNADATREKILSIRNRLMQTDIEDIVILSFSGHGMLDDKLNFYCATHDIDFNAPAGRGLSYDDIEALLADVPARKKLVLIDACNSGEADSEQFTVPQKNVFAAADLKEKSKIGAAKGFDIKNKSRQNSFDVMRHMFGNTARSNGAVVISAAGAGEYAYEFKNLDNGAFTYAVKNGLFESKADKDGYSGVTVNELKNYISTQVEELTNGKQKPTTRKENLSFDWSLTNQAKGFDISPVAKRMMDSADYWKVHDEPLKRLDKYLEARNILLNDSNYVNYDYVAVCDSIAKLAVEHNLDSAALMYYEEADEILVKLRENTGRRTDILYAISGLQQKTGKFDKAENTLLKSLAIIKKVSGEQSWHYVFTLNQMAIVYDAEGNVPMAQKYFEEAVKVNDKLGSSGFTENYFDRHRNTAVLLNNLASNYQKQKKYTAEIPLRNRIFSLKKFNNGYNSPEIADPANDLAIAYQNAGLIHKADSIYNIAIECMEKVDSSRQKNRLTMISNRAYLNKDNKKYDIALPLFIKMVEVAKIAYGNRSVSEGYYLNELGLVYELDGKLKEAADCFLQSGEVYGELKDEKSVGIVSNNLKRVKLKVADK